MKTGIGAILALSLLPVMIAALGSVAHAQSTTEPVAHEEDPLPTPGLVREIQHMLARLGLNPGPADGNPKQRTNLAVRLFEETHNLPVADLKRGEKVPAGFIALLRDEAARPMPGRAERAPGGAQSHVPKSAPQGPIEEHPAVKTATEAVAPPQPKASQSTVASCSYDPEDFHIGPNRYTPDIFLKEGFDGSVTHAVARLEDHLAESRQIADRIGASALNEVQRQARVLQYFQCRLRSEQGSAGEK
jgi:peptidoglycan hydrolase-like protein with peptidoglycan-binding domain